METKVSLYRHVFNVINLGKYYLKRERYKIRGYHTQVRMSHIKKRLAKKAARGEKIRVGFMGYQSADSSDVFTAIYRLFVKDSRFDTKVVIVPYTHDSTEEMLKIYQASERYLSSLQIPFCDGYDQIKKEFINYKGKFDVVFFQAEYSWIRQEFQAKNYPEAMSFLVPYGPYLADNLSDSHFCNPMMYDLYKIFPLGRSEYDMLSEVSYIGKKNINKFIGNPKTDCFFDKNYIPQDRWKKQEKKKKRIIWAPHHLWADYSNFMDYYEWMVEVAQKYKDELQIAFKPHPALAASLLEKVHWTEKEIQDYIDLWKTMPNTQYENGSWIDLFLTSDAMILDSIGFMAEYSQTKKPACVLYREKEHGVREKRFNKCGEEIYNKLYHAKNTKEVIEFIDNVVIHENDVMKDERIDYILKQYSPPGNGSAAQNIYEQICEEIRLQKI